MTAPSQLRLRSIFDLLTERFSIPPYQRGYRWELRQVEALLNDLAEFQLSSRQLNLNTFYCLQPVVVRRLPENVFELIDGQQRLTTIFLIIGALRDVATMLNLGCYEITYQTRDGRAEYLRQPTPEAASDSPDNHYMYEADKAIRRWFAEHDGSLRLRLLDCLTARDGTAPNVRVIWYELNESQSPVQAFVRLNIGRIPLTSAELNSCTVIALRPRATRSSRRAANSTRLGLH